MGIGGMDIVMSLKTINPNSPGGSQINTQFTKKISKQTYLKHPCKIIIFMPFIRNKNIFLIE